MFSTIRAKFPATCRRCHTAINVGQKMRYGGRGRTYHLKADCPQAGDGGAGAAVLAARHDDLHYDDEDELARTYATPNGVSHYTRFSSGAEVYVNRNGRCEDAPCCGCCS